MWTTTRIKVKKRGIIQYFLVCRRGYKKKKRAKRYKVRRMDQRKRIVQQQSRKEITRKKSNKKIAHRCDPQDQFAWEQ